MDAKAERLMRWEYSLPNDSHSVLVTMPYAVPAEEVEDLARLFDLIIRQIRRRAADTTSHESQATSGGGMK